MFQDITTLLLDPQAFRDTIDLFVERYKDKNISVVAGEKTKRKTFFFFHLFTFSVSEVLKSFDLNLFMNFLILSYFD